MNLKTFVLTPKNPYSSDPTLMGKVELTLDTGLAMTVELSPPQIDLLSATIAEMVTQNLRDVGRQLAKGTLRAPVSDNLLPAPGTPGDDTPF